MAVPSNYIDKITKGNDSRDICPAADKVRVDNDNFEGTDLDGVLDEIAESISGAGGGTVESVTINGTKHTPDSQGDVDLGNITGAKGDKGDKGDTVVLDPSQVEQFDIINGLNAQSAGDALDAYQGAQLKAKINEVYTRLKSVYSALGNIAFWDGKPAASTILPDLDWGLPKHTVTLDLTLTNAVVKHNGVAVADGATIQVEEYTALTLLVEASSGYALQSVTSSTTGAVVTDNGNGTYNVALTMGQSNVTLDITATAAQAYTITYGTMANCSVVTSPAPTSILGGQSVEIEFSTESGYELDSSCFTVANADKAWNSSTNKLTISNATGNVTISATAEMPKIKFLKGYRWDNSTSYNHTSIINSQWLVNGVDKHGNLAASEMIKIPAPASAISSWPTVFVYWGINPQTNDNTRPLAIGFYEIGENNTFTFLGYYLFKNTVLYNTIAATSCGWASGKSSSDVIQAYNNGKLGIRVTICTSNNALLTHTDGRGVTFGGYTFKPNNPAGNYKIITDATGFENEIFVVE